MERNSELSQIQAKGAGSCIPSSARIHGGLALARRHNLSQDVSLQLKTVLTEGCSCEPSESVFSVAEDRGASPEEESWEDNTVSSVESGQGSAG